MALPEKHFKKLFQATEQACCDEKIKEDIMQSIIDQNKKTKGNYKKNVQFCLWTSVFLALSFLVFFVQDIGFDFSPQVQRTWLLHTLMAFIFIITIYAILGVHNGLSKAIKSEF